MNCAGERGSHDGRSVGSRYTGGGDRGGGGGWGVQGERWTMTEELRDTTGSYPAQEKTEEEAQTSKKDWQNGNTMLKKHLYGSAYQVRVGSLV